MTVDELKVEIDIELVNMTKIVKESKSLLDDINGKEPTVREKTAAAAFLAQFYNGIENILKRICRFCDVQLPTGNIWHIELFKRFCEPSYSSLPALFDESLASAIAPFRKFRHVFFHGYGFQLEWTRMRKGIVQLEDVFLMFKTRVLNYLETLK